VKLHSHNDCAITQLLSNSGLGSQPLLKLDRTPEAKPAPGGPGGGLGLRYFTISVPDIRGLMAQLEAKGVRPTVSVREARPGITIAMVTDPDGNTVEFLQNTASK
jgi:catechol 2,3-dioxygenase-like lactoylglutathione lyase family enzyme